jgi:hypothetical protein
LSVVEACVAFDRLVLRKSASRLRPGFRRLARAVPRAFARGALGTEALHRRPGLQHCSIDRKMLGAQEPFHLRQTEERRQKRLRDCVREQAVTVLREGVERLLVDHKPDEPAKQHVELQPFDQPSLRADRMEKLQKRSSQEGAPAQSRGARSARKAPKTSGRVQPAPHRSAAASPATAGPPGCAPRRRRKRTGPRSSDPRPASIPRDSLMTSLTESCENNKHQRLVARLFQQPGRVKRTTLPPGGVPRPS